MTTKITKNYSLYGYEQILKFISETKVIFFIDCTCGDFEHRRMRPIDKLCDTKIVAEPCKHLEPIVKIFEDEGFTMKEHKEIDGPDRCPSELRKALIKRSDGLCEQNCGRVGYHPHRKIRNSNGGKYTIDNCVWLCDECHEAVHGNEFPGVQGK